jgi:hypothetical protein
MRGSEGVPHYPGPFLSCIIHNLSFTGTRFEDLFCSTLELTVKVLHNLKIDKSNIARAAGRFCSLERALLSLSRRYCTIQRLTSRTLLEPLEDFATWNEPSGMFH